jgi:putative resolvase
MGRLQQLARLILSRVQITFKNFQPYSITNNMDGWVTSRKAKQSLGISSSTLYRWTELGKIQCNKRPGRYSLYNFQGILATAEASDRKNIIYVRVSSHKQTDDLERQISFMAAKFPGWDIVKDVGSGINFKRPGLLSILDRSNRGEISQIAVASRDRLCRFAFELIEHVLRINNTKLLVLDGQESSAQSELSDDLMSIVQVFCCRRNGKRRYTRKTTSDQSTQGQAEPDQGTKSVAEAVEST